jgi:hypothetical protein
MTSPIARPARDLDGDHTASQLPQLVIEGTYIVVESDDRSATFTLFCT